MLAAAKALGALLLPPGVLVLVALIGLLLLPRRPRLGAALAWVAVVALLVLSLPVTGHALLDMLTDEAAALALDDPALGERADAIVVLAGGREWNAPEYGTDTVNAFTLERLRYAARLHRATGLPVLVSGGALSDEHVPEAALMQRALAQDFQVPVRWVEGYSRNTYENALYARAFLEAAGVRTVFVVTHAWHMPRALWSFRSAALETVAAPMGFGRRGEAALDLLPTAYGLRMSSRALRECLGLLWYRVRYGPGTSGSSTSRASSVSRRPSG